MEEFINLLQEFAFNLAVAILPIIAGFVVAALNALVKKWLADLEASKPKLAEYLSVAAEIAVAAAEKMEFSGFIKEKKQYAIEIAQAWLDAHGWDEVDIDVLEAAIEAEVLKQFPGDGPVRMY